MTSQPAAETATMPIALVTGTSTGIGYATALHLARNGFRTYATMRNLAKAGPLRAAAAAQSLPVDVIQLDVDDDASMSAGITRILAQEGRVDVLVNNAGIGYGMPIEYVDMKSLRAVMETNFFGAARMMQLVIPGMREPTWSPASCSPPSSRRASPRRCRQAFLTRGKSKGCGRSSSKAWPIRHCRKGLQTWC
jgi:NAD(P)-dependent dehydrogenase (short-subunit alcohol dehydrogenase family)